MGISTIDRRVYPVLLAYGTSGVSKIATAVAQLLAFPIAAASIGTEGLGAILALMSIVAFLVLPVLGLGPSTSYGMAFAQRDASDDELASEFWTPLLIGCAFAAIAVLSGLVLLQMAGSAWLLGAVPDNLRSEVQAACYLALAHIALFSIGAFIEGGRSALEETHHTNIFSAVASAAVLGGCFVVAHFEGSIALFYCAIFVIPPFFQLLNLLHFSWRHRARIGRPRLASTVLTQVLVRSLRYSKAQAGFVMHVHGSVYIASAFVGLNAGAIIGLVNRLFALFLSTLLSLANPVLPLVTKSISTGERRDALRIIRGIVIVSVLVPIVFAALFAFVGPRIVDLWIGIDLGMSSGLAMAFGLFFIVYSATNLVYLTLLAAGGVGQLSWYFLASGLIALAVDYALSGAIGVTTIVLVSAVAMLALNGVASAIYLRRTFAELKA